MTMREGFEPSIQLRVYTLSRRAPSATRTPHQKLTTFMEPYCKDYTLEGQASFATKIS